MATVGGDLGRPALPVNGLLGLGDGAGGLHRHADHQRGAGADATEGATGIVLQRALRPEGVIVLAAAQAGAGEARPQFHALYRTNGHAGQSQQAVQLAESRIAQPHGQALDPHLADAAHAVALGPGGFHRSPLGGEGRRISNPQGVGLHEGPVHGGPGEAGDLPVEAAHRHAQRRQLLLGPGPGRHAGQGLPAAAAASATGIPHAVLAVVGEVRMAGPKEV